MSKLAITYICTGKYKKFFEPFYESFRENFCTEEERTFVVITDDVEFIKSRSKGDILVYDAQRRFKKDDDNTDYCKFRKWKDILLAEDFIETQDYAFYFNSNTICVKPTSLSDLFQGKDEMTTGLKRAPKAHNTSKSPSAAWYDTRGTEYVGAGMYGAVASKFLQCSRFIEACRNYDAIFGYDTREFVPWHDETYFNKYISTARTHRSIMTHERQKGIKSGSIITAFCSFGDTMKAWKESGDKSSYANIAIYNKEW